MATSGPTAVKVQLQPKDLPCGNEVFNHITTDAPLFRGFASYFSTFEVQLLAKDLPCGSEVTIHITTDTPLLEVKRQLHLLTGVPIQHQKVMLSGINQIVMGDKRTMKFARCGTASSFYFAVAGKKEQQA